MLYPNLCIITSYAFPVDVYNSWVNVFRISSEFRNIRLTFYVRLGLFGRQLVFDILEHLPYNFVQNILMYKLTVLIGVYFRVVTLAGVGLMIYSMVEHVFLVNVMDTLKHVILTQADVS